MEKKLLKRYELPSTIGNGTYAIVYRVQDAEDNYILKVVKQIDCKKLRLSMDDIIKEAKLLSKLDHPFILKYFSHFSNENLFHIVSEFCENGDLGKRLDKHRDERTQVNIDDALNWFVQMLLAVQYIHSEKIIHRDLKPSNIFLAFDTIEKIEIAKVGDFGISKELTNTTPMASTFIGTPSYMSPEMLEDEKYDYKVDIWSLGCIIFELLTNKVAFEGKNMKELSRLISHEHPPDLPNFYSEDLREIVSGMLQKNPNHRPALNEILKINALYLRCEKITK